MGTVAARLLHAPPQKDRQQRKSKTASSPLHLPRRQWQPPLPAKEEKYARQSVLIFFPFLDLLLVFPCFRSVSSFCFTFFSVSGGRRYVQEGCRSVGAAGFLLPLGAVRPALGAKWRRDLSIPVLRVRAVGSVRGKICFAFCFREGGLWTGGCWSGSCFGQGKGKNFGRRLGFQREGSGRWLKWKDDLGTLLLIKGGLENGEERGGWRMFCQRKGESGYLSFPGRGREISKCGGGGWEVFRFFTFIWRKGAAAGGERV